MKFPALFLIASLSIASAGDVINAGRGGNRTTHLLKRIDSDVIALQPSLVVIMVGTNDRLNSGGFISIEDYVKNLETICSKIQTGGAGVLLVTPPPCIPELLFSRHDPAKFADQAPNDRILEVREKLLLLSEKHQIPLVDFYQHIIDHDLGGNDEQSILKNLKNSDKKDGVHFTDQGYQLLAKLVSEGIAKYQLDTKKVICFGDSLTQGPKNGSTYPVALAKLLGE